MSLPSRWNPMDRFPGIEVPGEGLEVKFNGTTRTADEGAAIRSDHPIPPECGIYYYEITVLSKGKDR